MRSLSAVTASLKEVVNEFPGLQKAYRTHGWGVWEGWCGEGNARFSGNSPSRRQASRGLRILRSSPRGKPHQSRASWRSDNQEVIQSSAYLPGLHRGAYRGNNTHERKCRELHDLPKDYYLLLTHLQSVKSLSSQQLWEVLRFHRTFKKNHFIGVCLLLIIKLGQFFLKTIISLKKWATDTNGKFLGQKNGYWTNENKLHMREIKIKTVSEN